MPPGLPTPRGRPEPAGPFACGYPYAATAADGPVRPEPPAPAGDAANVYVYREHEAPDTPPQDEYDPSYWYDLSGDHAAPAEEKTRGPFEPLVSSAAVPQPAPATAPDAPEPGAAPGSPGAPDPSVAPEARDAPGPRDAPEPRDVRADRPRAW